MTLWNSMLLALKGGAAPPRPALGRTYAGIYSGDFSGEMPASYTALVKGAMHDNAIAQRAVRIVSEGVASAPICGGEEKLLRLISATSAGQSLLETLAAQVLLHGNGYVQVLLGTDGAPAELFALRPDRVTIEPDARGWPAAYLYRAGEHVTRIAPTDDMGRPAIIHIKTFHPTDDHYGLGCLGAAAAAVGVHNAAARWNKAILDNAARPSGALVYDNGDGAVLSAEQFDRLKAQMEASFSGSGNAGRPMLLEGGLSWQQLSMTPADMDFVALKAAAAREIALAFGVPPMLLGLQGDNTYANYREANRALWRLTILPMAGKILRSIGEGLRPWWPENTLSVDLDQVTALSEDRERLWAQVTAAEFLSPDEKRSMLGLEQNL